jgi:ribonuclease HI
MIQQSLWCSNDDPKLEPSEWKLYIDGASRNNPGPSGAGIYLIQNGTPQEQQGYYLGICTNNQAEYLALIIGLVIMRIYLNDQSIDIISDSQLLVRQMTGHYKVRNPELQKLQKIAFALLEDIEYRFCHVLRENNKEADALANLGIDKKIPLPDHIAKLLESYSAL